jgi:hypothetical protein
MTIPPQTPLLNKLYRIGLHLTCLFVYPVTHAGFHIAGIAREFRF